MSLKKVALWIFIITLTLFASACPKRVKIGEIKADPGRFENKDVAVAGTVTDSYGISVPFRDEKGGIYEIEDESGSIWVVTDRAVPGKDIQLGVKGRIERGFTYKGKNYGLVLIEEGRKYRKD
ncbi:MAG: hypothetical protein HKN33_10925 [Pyrinomonadaceae bacterium]|nr:hypothetical protein [Pyrinomonadaceae bacterium]